MLPGVREMAQRAFEERFKARIKDLFDTLFRQAIGPDADPRSTQYAVDRVLGKVTQSLDLSAGYGLAGVEVTYRIIGTPKSDG